MMYFTPSNGRQGRHRKSRWIPVIQVVVYCVILFLLFIIILPKDLDYITDSGTVEERPITTERTERQWLDIIVNEQLNKNVQSTAPFASQMAAFPWPAFKASLSSKDLTGIQSYSTVLLSILIPFVVREPPVPVNKSCRPPPLTFPSRSYPPTQCQALRTPRKVGVLINFGFDVDTLEIHLQELDAVVDKFFILEASRPHNFRLNNKPSMWDLVKYTPRFLPFLSKVVHFMVDDASQMESDLLVRSGSISGDKRDFMRETLEVTFRWKKFLEWNQFSQYFRADDLLGFGDTDEIPNRNNIHFLKHCQLPADPMDIGIWVPSPFLNLMRPADFSVRGHPFTLGDPTYWTLGAAMDYWTKEEKAPTRNTGSSSGFMLGGIHMTKYPYLPFQMVKELAATPTKLVGFEDNVEVGMMYRNNGENGGNMTSVDMEAMHWWHKNNLKTGWHIFQFEDKYGRKELNAIRKIPWFLNCNPGRYPAIYGKRDPRLDGQVEEAPEMKETS